MVQEKKDTLIDFPCDFPIKIIGIVSEEFTSIFVDIFKNIYLNLMLTRLR